MRHAVINEKTHRVENVIVWDGKSKWSPPQGTYVIRHDTCNIGNIYDSKTKSFSNPPEESPDHQ